MKQLSLLLAICTMALSIGLYVEHTSASSPDVNKSKERFNKLQAGNYLASRFAQSQHDWEHANKFIHKLINAGISQDKILQRAMILAMGSGNTDDAIKLAKRIQAQDPDSENTVAKVFLIAESMQQDNYEQAAKIFDKLSQDATTQFIGPFIKGWVRAGQKKLDIKKLKNNTVQLYHAILISDFLGNHNDIEKMIDKALKVEDINLHERERIADLYGHVGLKKKALDLYDTIIKKQPENEAIKNKIENLKQNTNEPLFKKVKTARYGMAKAFHDISNILYNENNEESARVFGHLALFLEPDLTSTKFLLAEIAINHEQYEEAISMFRSVAKSDKAYVEAQHEIADVYEKMEEYEKALNLLNTISKKHQDVDTLIKIGNLYRHQERFEKSLISYNKAYEKLGRKINKEYWHLHYVRGISYEQVGQWEKAEAELKAALELQPDHPYILNYLGYAWADQGIHLQEALKMIQRAVELRPADGYITDSLGWVLYKVEDYEKAIPVLERAVELRPYDPTINDHLGDAYWKVGRHLEARFQWKRAQNHSEDEEQLEKIKSKLLVGLDKDT